ncbi:MAG: aminotransferase class V-fold PLP-dependent enzyme [Cytophagales bacterium]|nr:MAG: aminotransferase class V-fold PLP-dependent enzyme [Cytophagales bacterium]
MLSSQDFRKYAHQIADRMADYFEHIEQYSPKSQVSPQQILEALPMHAPEQPETMEAILQDFDTIIMQGITHWQHPSFFAYFPANNSYASVLAEMLTATLGAQCMVWDTSPAAAELEERMMQWIKQAMQLPQHWEGVIQDTASTATLCALLTAREQYSQYAINERGFENDKLTVYCSNQTHSSIEKAVKIAGIGKKQLRYIATDEQFAIRIDSLEEAIRKDLAEGYTPLVVVGNIGTTGSTAVDPIDAMGEICKKYHIFFHVDAAYAGSAALLPEKQSFFKGLEHADSYVFNPHKWLMTNFDCTAYFVKSKEALIRTFEILPEYLKTQHDQKVNNYRDWGIQLGRRFRALKLWFVWRSFGVEGLQKTLRTHLALAQTLYQRISTHSDFEILAPMHFNLVCFRYKPTNINNEETLNLLNAQLLERLNQSGKVYLSHTKLNGKYTLRVVVGQTNVNQTHIDQLWELLLHHKQVLSN